VPRLELPPAPAAAAAAAAAAEEGKEEEDARLLSRMPWVYQPVLRVLTVRSTLKYRAGPCMRSASNVAQYQSNPCPK
jgi:hypothetical protein